MVRGNQHYQCRGMGPAQRQKNALTVIKIFTIESDQEMVDVATKTFNKDGYDARIKIIKGWASDVSVRLRPSHDKCRAD